MAVPIATDAIAVAVAIASIAAAVKTTYSLFALLEAEVVAIEAAERQQPLQQQAAMAVIATATAAVTLLQLLLQ